MAPRRCLTSPERRRTETRFAALRRLHMRRSLDRSASGSEVSQRPSTERDIVGPRLSFRELEQQQKSMRRPHSARPESLSTRQSGAFDAAHSKPSKERATTPRTPRPMSFREMEAASMAKYARDTWHRDTQRGSRGFDMRSWRAAWAQGYQARDFPTRDIVSQDGHGLCRSDFNLSRTVHITRAGPSVLADATGGTFMRRGVGPPSAWPVVGQMPSWCRL